MLDSQREWTGFGDTRESKRGQSDRKTSGQARGPRIPWASELWPSLGSRPFPGALSLLPSADAGHRNWPVPARQGRALRPGQVQSLTQPRRGRAGFEGGQLALAPRGLIPGGYIRQRMGPVSRLREAGIRPRNFPETRCLHPAQPHHRGQETPSELSLGPLARQGGTSVYWAGQNSGTFVGAEGRGPVQEPLAVTQERVPCS